MPIIGPIPKTKSTNFAEFFVWPNFWSFKIELVWFFFDFFFFMKDILLQHDFKRFSYVIGLEKNFYNWQNLYGSQKRSYCIIREYKGNMSATKREEVCSHLRYIRLELREMHQMLIKEDLLPDLNEAKEVLAQMDALLDLLSEKRETKIKSQFWNFRLIWIY